MFVCISLVNVIACVYLRASEPLSWTPKWEAVGAQNLLSTKLPCSVECLENYLIIHNNERLINKSLYRAPGWHHKTHLAEMLLSLEWKSVQQFTSGPRLSFTFLHFPYCLSFVLWFFHFHKALLAKKWTGLQPKFFLPYLNTARNQMEGWWFRWSDLLSSRSH